MNKLKELREQAWTLVSDEQRDRGELYDSLESWERCDQEFARLIIRHSADFLDPADAMGVYDELTEYFFVDTNEQA